MEKKSPFSLPTFSQIALGLCVATVVIQGLALLPFTDNFVFDTKLYGFFLTTILLLAAFVGQAIKRRSFNIVLAPFTLPLVLFATAVGASTFLTNSYPVEHLLGFGGAYLAVTLFALFGGSIAPKDSVKSVVNTTIAVGCVITLFSVLELLGAGPARLYNQIFGFSLPTTLLFNLSGSSFIALQLISLGLVGALAQVIVHKKLPTFLVVTVPILLIGIAIHTWSILPGKVAELRLPSFAATWSVALDAIRQPRSAIIGAGPSSFQNVYAQFKPAWVNGQPDWNVQYAQGANFPLTALSTLGFFGLVTWLFLAIRVLQQTKHVDANTRVMAIATSAILVLHFFFPPNIVTVALFGLYLAVLIAAQRDRLSVLRFQALTAQISGPKSLEAVSPESQNRAAISMGPLAFIANPIMIMGIILFLGIGYLGLLASKSYAASVFMFASNKAAQENDAAKTYELQQRAVALNPYLDTFRRRYALTNALIAVALSNKTDITEDEKNQVTELLQQAIREARSATILDQSDTQNWLVLAQVYQNIIGATEDALSWSVQSYVKAIETNPSDPNTRIALGGIFLSQKEYQQAAALFEQAANIKPDFANAHYNLAVSLTQLNQLEGARTEYQRVLSLIDATSTDYALVSAELEKVEKELESQKKKAAAAGVTPDVSDQKTGTPSIIDQNLETESSLINNPSNGDAGTALDAKPAPSAQPETPSSSPEPTPTE